MMQKITIPERLKEKISEGSFVYTLCKNVEPLIDLNMIYFQEYTKHDEMHINAVLEHANALIPNETLDVLNERSIEVLIGAIVIHDLGMFIQRDGLEELLFGEYKEIKTDKLDKHSWNERWKIFYRKVKRYNSQQMNNRFGMQIDVRNIPLDCITDEGDNWRIYGEFLRQYHHCLAYDIVQYGFPGNQKIDIFNNCDTGQFGIIKELIGLIGTSHGMAIRDTYIYVENHRLAHSSNAQLILNIPVYYLMCIIRMADYLHAGEQRAPKARIYANRITSDISYNEFIWNQAVYETMIYYVGRNIHRGGSLEFAENKGYVEIIADPKDGPSYLKLEKWMRTLQYELDICWAVLAEKYNNEYRLSIYRINSNILDAEVIKRYNQSFLTRRVELTANPNLVKLLVAPLYGDNPSYGVRELLQNAVDACNERSEIEKSRNISITKKSIEINVNTNTQLFSITDNGIGMNEDVISNYYMVAGASFRDSILWKERFKNDENKSMVVRSGRFGVGALASFLLGDRVTVITRHIDDELGYKFVYSLCSEQTINVERVKEVEYGTHIEIEMSEAAVKYFEKEDKRGSEEWTCWYYFKEPKISYILNGGNIEQQSWVEEVENEEKGWYFFESKSFENLLWGYNYKNSESRYEINNKFLINGILVDRIIGAYQREYDYWDSKHWSIVRGFGFDIYLPSISLIDTEGELKINLARTKIEKFVIDENFIEEILKFFLADLLCIDVKDKNSIWGSQYGYIPIAFSDKGYTVCARSFILYTGMKIWINIGCFNVGQRFQELGLPYSILPGFNNKLNIQSLHFSSGEKIGKGYINGELLYSMMGYENCCRKILIDRSVEQSLIRPWGLGRDYKVIKNTILSSYCDDGMEEIDYELAKMVTKDNPLIIEYLPTPIGEQENNIMIKLLKKYLPIEQNAGWIPYDMEERKQMYRETFRALEKYMKKC